MSEYPEFPGFICLLWRAGEIISESFYKLKVLIFCSILRIHWRVRINDNYSICRICEKRLYKNL